MVLAGQRRQLVVCLVSDLAPSSGHAVWISGGNGSILQSFAYGASQEDGGTVCSVSLLSSDPPRERELSCHVGANRTSPSHSSSPIRITGMTLLPPRACLGHCCPAWWVHWWPLRREGGWAGPLGPAGSRCEALGANVAVPITGRGLWPALHLVLGCQRAPSCSFIPQATRRQQSCVAQLVSLCGPCLVGISVAREKALAVAWLGFCGSWDGFSPQSCGTGEEGRKLHLGGKDGETGSEPACPRGQHEGDTRCLWDV